MKGLFKKVMMIGLAIVLPLSNVTMRIVAEESTEVEVIPDNKDNSQVQSKENVVMDENEVTTKETKSDEDIDTGAQQSTNGIEGSNFSSLMSVDQQANNQVEVKITKIEIVDTFIGSWSSKESGKIYDGTPDITANITVQSEDSNYTETVNAVQVEICDVNGVSKSDYKSNYGHVKIDINSLSLTNFNDNLYDKVNASNNVYEVDDFAIGQKVIDLEVTVESKKYDSSGSVKVKSVNFVDDSQFVKPEDKPSLTIDIFKMFGDAEVTLNGFTLLDAELEYSKAFAFYNFNLDWGNYTPNITVSINNTDKTQIITRNSLQNFPPSVEVVSSDSNGKFMPDATLTASVDTTNVKNPIEVSNLLGLLADAEAEQLAEFLSDNLVYQWYRDDTKIEGETNKQYIIKKDDIDKAISCQVSVAKNYDNIAKSEKYDVTLDGKEVIKGTIDVSSNSQGGSYVSGSVLTLDFEIDANQAANTTTSIQWYRDNTLIQNATFNEYTLTKEDFGKTLTVRVVDSSGKYGGSLTKQIPISPINPDNVKNVSVTADYANNILTIDWDKPDFNGGSSILGYQLEYSYDGKSGVTVITIQGENNTSYDLAVSDLFPGKEVEIRIKANNIAGFSSGVTETKKIDKYAAKNDDPLISINGIDVSYAVTNSQIKPNIEVLFGSTALDSSHYTVSYGSNNTIGTGTVDIQFTGDSFSGTINKTFSIVQNQPTVSAPEQLTSGKEVVYDSNKIEVGTDFVKATLSNESSATGDIYYIFTNENVRPTTTPSDNILPIDVGTYYIWAYFEGDGNNAAAWSSTSLEIKITKRKLTDTEIKSPTVKALTYKNDLLVSDATLTDGDIVFGKFTWDAPTTPLKVGNTTVKVIFTPRQEYEKNYDFSNITLEREITIVVNKGEFIGNIIVSDVKQGTQPTPQLDPNPEGAKITYRYKLQGAPDDKYETSIPVNASVGATYICEAFVESATNYNDKRLTTSFTILEKDVEPVKPSAPSTSWDDGGPFTKDNCGNIFDRWGNVIYNPQSCNAQITYEVPNTGIR